VTEFVSLFKLTKREREIMGFIVQGMRNDEIATALYISVQTVKNNISAIYRKTGVKNRVQLGNVLRNYEESGHRYRADRVFPAPPQRNGNPFIALIFDCIMWWFVSSVTRYIAVFLNAG
jgi:DNA-binding CsgD family transcriptional regulator